MHDDRFGHRRTAQEDTFVAPRGGAPRVRDERAVRLGIEAALR